MGEIKNVTSIETLKQYMSGSLVELPPFADGQQFVARLKRPSILKLVTSGKIPNSLLSKTNELFLMDKAGFDPEEPDMLKEMSNVMEILVSQSFVEPTYEQLTEAGIELTDDQIMFIFNYSQQGVKSLESFRTE